jgi:arsenite-transporting ATPase
VRAVSVVLDELQQEHRVIRQQLAGVARPEAADRLIEMLAAQAQVTGALLRNHARTIFRWVTLAEDLALAETADGLAALARGRIHVAEVIVNRVVPAGAACRICDLRRAEERRALARWSASSGTRAPIRIVFEDPREPRGVRRLAPIGERLSGALPRLKRGRVIATRSTRVALRTSGLGIASTPFLSAVAGARLLFFGGKGGVGKTTTASAAAMALARASPGRVLLLSTDPAHSLADVFDVAVGDRPVQIRGAPSNLEVRELDAAAALARRRGDLEAALREIADVVGAGPRARGVSELMDLAPPGIDELFGVLSVITARRAYRTIIIDTAPTGHALRLLALPDAVREWVQVLLRVLLKYRDLLRPGRLATELVALSRAVRHLQQLLRDPAQSRFIVVTRAAEVPRLETERLLQLLRKLRVATPVLIVNARTLQPDGCQRCRTIAAREARELPAIIGAGRRASRDCVIIQTPLAAPPPRGAQPLRQWGDTWLKGES